MFLQYKNFLKIFYLYFINENKKQKTFFKTSMVQIFVKLHTFWSISNDHDWTIIYFNIHFSSMNFFYMEVFGIFWCKLLFTNVTGIIFWFIFMFSFKVSLQIPFKDSFFAIFTLDNFFGFFWFATFFGMFMISPLVSSEVCSFSKLGRANFFLIGQILF